MYPQIGRNLCRLNRIDRFQSINHSFRNYSKFSSISSQHILSINQNHQPNSNRSFKPTDLVIQNFVSSQRYFSVSTLRFNAATTTEAVLQSVNVASTEAVSQNVNSASTEAVASTTSAAAESSSSVPDFIPEKPAPLDVAASSSTETIANSSSAAVGGPTATTTESSELILDFIPEKPAPLDVSTIVGEPSFESLGLGNWWPTGRVQLFMEYLHCDIGMEWFQAIALTALCMRLCTFPFVVMSQKNVVNMNNNMPGMSALQDKMSDARKRGDQLESAQLGQQLQEYMSKAGINPIKNVLPMLVQVPIFMSMFLGLRGMANLPVPSMESGGLLWFENMTLMDPFYILPFATSCSLYLQFRVGADGNRMATMGPMGRVMMTLFPFGLFPISLNFPSAITFYWFTTNVISIGQALVLRVPAVRTALGIPQMIKWEKKDATLQKKKGFRESVRESIDNFRVQADIADRRALDEQAFKDAGMTKPIKTYSYDPSKPVAIKSKNKY